MASSLDRKKYRERAALDAFKRVFPSFPPGEIVHADEPDFLVASASHTTGIEHTEFFRSDQVAGSFLQEQESLRHQIAERATAKCLTANPSDVFATVFFAHSVRLTKRDVEPVADAVAALLRDCDPSWSGKVENDGQLPRFIDSVIGHRLPSLKQPFVTTTDATWVPEIGHDELQAIATKKEDKVQMYRTKCGDVWLLIEINGFRISSMATLPASIGTMKSSFDRIFVLNSGVAVTELPVAMN